MLRQCSSSLRAFLAALTLLVFVDAACGWGSDDVFVIALETPVSNGVPGPGAGNIEVAGATDTYTFTIARPTTIYADEITGSCNIGWKLTAPSGAVIFNDTVFCGVDPGVKALGEVGTYTLVVSATPTATGTYSFNLWTVEAPQNFAITLEQSVSNGVPGPGAGNLEEPGAKDVYTFSIATPTEIYAQDVSGSCSTQWSCVAPSGATIFADIAMCSVDPGSFALTEIGTYTITVSSNVGTTGTYSFKLWEFDGIDAFTISTKETVSNGVPGAGAGNLEEPGAIDEYTLSIETPTTIWGDNISGSCSMRWQMIAPSGAVIINDSIPCGNDPGVRALTEVGDYLIRFRSIEGVSGTYSFRIWELNDPESFPIALDQVIAPGQPAAGAGVLEEPGAEDRYLLTITSPKTIFANSLSGPCNLQWELRRSDGSAVFANAPMCTDPGQLTLAAPDTYTLRVASPVGATGSYSFVLEDVNPPQVFALNPEQVISSGIPGPGAGVIEGPGSVDQYLIELTAGMTIASQPISGPCSLLWSLTSPTGATIFANQSMCGSIQLDVLGESGTYTLTVAGSGDASGSYSAIVWVVDPPQDFVIAVGDVVLPDVPGPGAGNLNEPFVMDRYAFSGTAGSLVCFQPISGSCAMRWSVTTPSGATLFTGESLCDNPPGRFALPERGTYLITVSSVNGEVGNYGFALEEGSIADISPAEGDCTVNAADLAVLLGAWGPCPRCPSDLNGDGEVNASDLAILLGEWGN